MWKQILITITIALVITWGSFTAGYYVGTKQSYPQANTLNEIEQKIDRILYFFEGG